MSKLENKILKHIQESPEQKSTITDIMTQLKLDVTKVITSLESLQDKGELKSFVNASGLEVWTLKTASGSDSQYEEMPMVPNSSNPTSLPPKTVGQTGSRTVKTMAPPKARPQTQTKLQSRPQPSFETVSSPKPPPPPVPEQPPVKPYDSDNSTKESPVLMEGKSVSLPALILAVCITGVVAAGLGGLFGKMFVENSGAYVKIEDYYANEQKHRDFANIARDRVVNLEKQYSKLNREFQRLKKSLASR